MFKNTYVQTEHCIFTNANNTCILDLKHWFLYLFFIWLFYYSTPNFKLQEKFLQSKKAHQPKSMHRKMQAPICRQTKLYQTGISLREYHYTSIIYRKTLCIRSHWNLHFYLFQDLKHKRYKTV